MDIYMEIIRGIFKWFLDNKEWVFSGIGVTILSPLFLKLLNRIADNLNKDIEKERNETLPLQKVIDSEKKKYWLEKQIIGIPYKPKLSEMRRINKANDYTNDWDAYDPQLFYCNNNRLVNVGLVGKTENFLLYDISIKDGSMLIKTSEDSYVLAEGICGTSTTGGSLQPSIMEADYDNDGDNELAIRVWVVHGTGISIDSLFMVDKASDGCWYMFQFLIKDFFNEIYKKYNSTVIDNMLYFSWENNIIDIPQKLENIKHFDYYCIGRIAKIEYSAEEILVKFAVGYNLDFCWDYSSGHGIMAKLQYQGENKWKLIDYDYYNESLERYITKIMDLYFTNNIATVEQECNIKFPTFYKSITEYDIIEILYDKREFGNDTFRVDVMFTVHTVDVREMTYQAILTIMQNDSYNSTDNMTFSLWKICDFMIIE